MSRKAQALFIYLAVNSKLHSRERLAELFWPEMPVSKAMSNLRTVLPNLRQLLGSHLLITRQTVAFNRECPYHLDVEAIQEIGSCSRTANVQCVSVAVTQYSGDFLEGFYVPGAPEFENWVLGACKKITSQLSWDNRDIPFG
jgi:DNA-binding SARP family transcriptional activator